MKTNPALVSAVALVLSATFVAAQDNPPPDRPVNPPPAEGSPRREGAGRPEGAPPRPIAGLFQVLDANRDGAIDATELAEGIKKFDKDGDGKITPDEFRAVAAPGRGGDGDRPPGERVRDGDRRREGERNREEGRARGPRDGDRPPGDRPESGPREGERPQRGGEGSGGRGPAPQPPREGAAPAPREPRAGERGDRPPGPPPQAFHRHQPGPRGAEGARFGESRRPAYGMQAPPPPRSDDRREGGRPFANPPQAYAGARLAPRDPQGPPPLPGRWGGAPLAYRQDFRAPVPPPPPRDEAGYRPPNPPPQGPRGSEFHRGPEDRGPGRGDGRGGEARPFPRGPEFRAPQPDDQRPPGRPGQRGEDGPREFRPGPPPPPAHYPVEVDESQDAII